MSNISYRNVITADELRGRLNYDCATGIFTWASSSRRGWIGRRAGTITPHGYIQIFLSGNLYQAHRLVWLYVYGRWPKEQIDHINGSKSDNRLVNLREASLSQNRYNVPIRSDNTTGFTGVCLKKSVNRFCAQYQRDGERVFLGYFDEADDAYAAYIKAISYRGEFIPKSAELIYGR
jgi:hypothetical protein